MFAGLGPHETSLFVLIVPLMLTIFLATTLGSHFVWRGRLRASIKRKEADAELRT